MTRTNIPGTSPCEPIVGLSRSARWTELAAPVVLTLCFVFAAGSVLGLAMSDDSSYMQNSWFLNASTFAKYREWAPLYTVWFQALNLVCRNPIHRYFLSWGLLVSLLCLIPASMKFRSAWLYTVIVLATPIFTIWPFVSLLAATIVLLSICCLLRMRTLSLPASAAAACLVCFVVSFVRPEFDYGVYTAALAAFALLVAATAALRAVRITDSSNATRKGVHRTRPGFGSGRPRPGSGDAQPAGAFA